MRNGAGVAILAVAGLAALGSVGRGSAAVRPTPEAIREAEAALARAERAQEQAQSSYYKAIGFDPEANDADTSGAYHRAFVWALKQNREEALRERARYAAVRDALPELRRRLYDLREAAGFDRYTGEPVVRQRPRNTVGHIGEGYYPRLLDESREIRPGDWAEVSSHGNVEHYKLDFGKNGSYHHLRYVINGEGVAGLTLKAKKPWRGSESAVIDMVYTHEAHRRQGYARALLEEARRYFRQVKHSRDLTGAGKKWKAGVQRSGSRATMDRRNNRWYPNFYGTDRGAWRESANALLSFRRVHGFDWAMVSSMSSRNDWRNWHVEGATEYSPGFLKALSEIGTLYPEALDFDLKFDGPWMKVGDLLRRAPDSDRIVWLHGTSTVAWGRIKKQGLRPRRQTGARPAYGAHIGQAAVADQQAVYLTTQMGTARAAALDAARVHGGDPVILEIRDVDTSRLDPDEDSHATSWRGSLETLGSVKHRGSISPQQIRILEEL